MANTKSARKAIRVSERRRMQNKPVRSTIKTYTKRAVSAIAAAPGEALQSVIVAQSVLDKAATKGVIHRNAAARRKSRLMKKLNQAQAATA